LEARSEQLEATPAGPPVGAPADTAAPAPQAGQPSAEQIYSTSLQQLRRGSPATARMGFRELLRLYPSHARVPDATYFVGETYAAEAPDSAAAYYTRVVETYPRSPRAASALYKLGLLRSEEHTSELQSRENLVCRLLLEKKNEI